MFPIIPHSLKSSSELGIPARMSISVVKRCGEVIVQVTAVTDIPRDTASLEVDAEELLEVGDSVGDSKRNLSVCQKEGLLQPTSAPSAWLRHLRLAADCHSCNVMLQRGQQDSSKLRLQVIQPIRKGEELKLWFAQPILVALGIPFLTPANIQGDKCYVCHRCCETFETPNPLKLHLALQCSQLDKNILYSRLIEGPRVKTEAGEECNSNHSRVLNLKTSIRTSEHLASDLNLKIKLKSNSSFKEQQLSPMSFDRSSNSCSPVPSTSLNKDIDGIRRDQGNRHKQDVNGVRSSAFKPYWKRSHITSGHSNLNRSYDTKTDLNLNIRPNYDSNPSKMSAFSFLTNFNTSSTTNYYDKPHVNHASTMKMTSVYKMATPMHENEQDGRSASEILASQPHLAVGVNSFFQHASEMETLVSNLGRSKQGHLCIYCGKIYSRKYGLKIHIRTHTGFKPLQCKFCLRPFGDPSNLNKHVRLHAEGATPYKCDLCGKILVRRRDLERHIKSRHSMADSSIPGSPS